LQRGGEHRPSDAAMTLAFAARTFDVLVVSLIFAALI
jgi:hypothetical protein